MKVGIMSMQRIINYGSYLQAYALSNTIRSLGHEVEFVDFKIEKCIDDPSRPPKKGDLYIPKKITEYSEKDKKDYYELVEFNEKFKNEFLKELGVSKRNERPELDTLVIGSDEVFNCLQDNSDVGYSLELFGKNHKANKLITYAACCGATTVERLHKFEKDAEISGLLNKFNAISVRDENSKVLVETLSNIEPINHLDPVLIYDFSDVVRDVVDIKDYIILYGYPFNFNERESNYIKEFAKKQNKKIVAIGTCQSCADIFIKAHPLEVLPYFKKADFVITNTFHGSIFAIKTHTPFVTAIKNYNSQKLSDLLNRLNLSDRCITSYSQLDEAYKKEVDFSKSDKIIETEKLRTIDYLKQNI